MRTFSLFLALGACNKAVTTTDTDTPTGTSGDTGSVVDEPVTCKTVARTHCVEIPSGDSAALQNAANTLDDDTAIVLMKGTYLLDNAVTVRGATGVTLIGQGMDETILDFSTMKAQANGVDMVGDDMHVEGFTIYEAVKDGLRIEESDGVVIRGIRVTWENENDSANGAYALYPVRVTHVLMENNEAFNASDAGIYVGQCAHAIVRNNVAKRNVAGIEIENTQFADVYGNLAEDNTGGIAVFDLPGNPIVGRDVKVHDNTIIDNNRVNFASGGTVRLIPVGTGLFGLATRRVEITGNTFARNDTVDIGFVTGLAVVGDPAQWFLTNEELVGDVTGLDLPTDDKATGVYNYGLSRVYVHGNTHTGSGTHIDFGLSDPTKEFANLIFALYRGNRQGPSDTVMFDVIGEPSFSPTDPSSNTNVREFCVGVGAGVTVGAFDLEAIGAAIDANDPQPIEWHDLYLYRPASPFAPYDCDGFTPGVIPPDLVVQ